MSFVPRIAVDNTRKRDPKAPLEDRQAEGAICELSYDLMNLRAAIALVSPADMVTPEAKLLFGAQVALYRRAVDPTPAFVRRELGADAGKVEAWMEKLDLENAELVGDVASFASLVRSYARSREIIAALEAALVAVRETPVRVNASDAVDHALEEPMKKLRSALGRRAQDIKPMREGRMPIEPTGHPTGFATLDHMTPRGRIFRGWVPGYHLAAARSGKGKTVFGLQCAMNVARAHAPSAVVSMELSEEKLSWRTELNLKEALRCGDISEEDADQIRTRLHILDVHNEDETTPERVIDQTLRLRDSLREDLGLIVFDYVQHPRWLGEDPMKGILRAVKALERLEREGLAALALAQFNRDADIKEGKPDRSMLFGSSYLVNYAASVHLLWRPKKATVDGYGYCEILDELDKQTNGPSGETLRLEWSQASYMMKG